MKFVVPLTVVLLCAVVGSQLKEIRPYFDTLRMEARAALSMPRNTPKPVFSDTSTAREADCPSPRETLLIVAGGQSNAGNYNSNLSASLPNERVFTFFDGKCYVAQDPMLGAEGTRGSLWPPLGADLARRLDRPVMFILAAAGGTRYSDWTATRAPYLDRLRAQISAAKQRRFTPALIIWHQGESDGLASPRAQQVEHDLHALASQIMQAAPDAEFYMFQASRCIGPKRASQSGEVRKAQAAVADTVPRIKLGFDTDTLGDDYRWDKCHFNRFGRQEIVSKAAADIERLFNLAAP